MHLFSRWGPSVAHCVGWLKCSVEGQLNWPMKMNEKDAYHDDPLEAFDGVFETKPLTSPAAK